MKKLFISSDHAGFVLKEQIKKRFKNKFFFIDLGTNDSKTSVNYPEYAHKLCKKVSKNSKNIGNDYVFQDYIFVLKFERSSF